MSRIDAMRDAAIRLRDLLEQGADSEAIGQAQRNFRDTVHQAMVAYKNNEIIVDLQNLPEVMYDFVINDMPNLSTAGPEVLRGALQKIKLFLNTMDIIIKPVEITYSQSMQVE